MRGITSDDKYKFNSSIVNLFFFAFIFTLFSSLTKCHLSGAIVYFGNPSSTSLSIFSSFNSIFHSFPPPSYLVLA
ncbi:Uncharacterized protein TCM_022832 [Theobroma cacao]|uniref:Uncharacterized protein n=1 Tax=Theobroma cacao TaxID=3641 RepID=A0A061ETM2_THECC|nr:Uncharacterized protein TCM_022832 [Theobroma cacao]